MEIMGKLLAALDRVKTPLTLSGLVVIVLYGLYSQVLKLPIFAQLPASSTFVIIRDLLWYLFLLAVLAIVLGAATYIVAHFWPASNHSDPDAPVMLKPVKQPRKPKAGTNGNKL
jgi:hypothetical protein